MLLPLLLTAVAVQANQDPQTLPPSPIARVVISPSQPVVVAGDSVQLTVRALNAAGQPIDSARFRFNLAGRFEARVDSTGMVRTGSPALVAVTVVAMVGGTRPAVERVEIRIVPGPVERVAITPASSKLVAGQRVRLGAVPYARSGDRRGDPVVWRSLSPAVARVDSNGVVTAVAPGRTSIVAVAATVEGRLPVEVVANTIASVEITPGDVHAKQGDVVRFRARALDRAGREISGLTPSWSFAPGEGMIDRDGAFVGYEAGPYVVSASFGTAVADAPVTLAYRDVRRQVEIVGRVPRMQFSTEEVWLHPNGRIAYLGTGSGGDRMYTIDISDPAHPVVTDSIVVNTRRVNDIMTTPDGKFMVFTREGATDRRNGIVLAALDDPAHPRVISEFTQGVTAGVHSTFIYRQERHGTHVYLTNDGTGAMHVIDINDPYTPKEVAQWRTPRADAGRSLHDIDIQNGLAYLSYWNDGLVVLDIGNGVKGGSPSNPQFVSQFKYDLNALYRDVEQRHGPGYIRGTHTAWRHKNYVFIADEVFPAGQVEGAKDAAAGRAFGRLQVIDVSDLEHPRPVAWYEPEYGGVHNVWVAGDTLYMGAYNAGFRAFDISGELRGDLRAQQREIVHVNTADLDGHEQNSAMTWGVVVRDGLAFVNDNNNGLWIVRMKPKTVIPVP